MNNNYLETLESLVQRAKQLKDIPTVAVVWPSDPSTLGAVRRAIDAGFARAIMVGCDDIVEQQMGDLLDGNRLSAVAAQDPAHAATLAVELVNRGEAHLLMKGLVNTDVLLKAVLDKEHGLLEPGNVLTHIAIAQIPAYHKLLFFSDVAVIPYPTPAQREAQVSCVTALCRALGVACPRVSLIHCSEKVNAKHFPHTAHYEQVKALARDNAFGPCIVDGPLDVKVSCCLKAAQTKGIDTPLQGEADALIFPDIESGNAFYKTITLFAGATVACLVSGARVPAVVPSRGDSEDTKYYSLAAACCCITPEA